MCHKKPTDPVILQRAREMRKNPAEPERRLWQKLRGRRLGGFKFRRQHPIGRFIVDFYCHQARLIVEVDGPIHATQKDYDRARTKWLEANGYRVIRFWNRQVIGNIEGVLQVILESCEQLSPPSP